MIDYKSKIKNLAREKGVTQQEIADYCGISANSVRNTLINNSSMSIDTIAKFCDAIGITIAELFSNNTTTPPPPGCTCPVCGARLNVTLSVEE